MKKLPSLYDLYQEKETCPHCDQSIMIRNPTGYCNHLFYPDECKVCKEELWNGSRKEEKYYKKEVIK